MADGRSGPRAVCAVPYCVAGRYAGLPCRSSPSHKRLPLLPAARQNPTHAHALFAPCARPVQDLRGTKACRWPADLARLARRPSLDLRLDSRRWKDFRPVPDWAFEPEEGGLPWEQERQAGWRAHLADQAARAAVQEEDEDEEEAEEEGAEEEEEAAPQPLAPQLQAAGNAVEVGGLCCPVVAQLSAPACLQAALEKRVTPCC